MKIEEVLIVSQTSKDAILGTPAFMAHQCSKEFERPVVNVDGKPMACTDRTEKLFQNKVHVIRDLVMPARTEVVVRRILTTQSFCPLGIIEGYLEGPPLATSLNEPEADKKVLVRCLNPNHQPLTL